MSILKLSVRTVVFFIAPVLLIAGLAPDTSGQDTLLISYQGQLTDDTGQPVSGSVDFNFGIYAMPTGTSLLWSEIQSGVDVTSGVFSVILGSQSALPDSIFTGHERYLGISVGADPEITPRTLLTSVPSAAIARRVVGDMETGDGTMLISTPAGDSAFAFNAGLSPSFTMFLMEPLDKQPLIEMTTGSAIGGRISIYDMEPLDKNEVIAIGSSPLGYGSIKMFNPQPEPPARLFQMDVSESLDQTEWGTNLSMYLMEPLDKKAMEMSCYPSTGASFKMFNPQPEPPAVLLDINATATGGATLSIYDEIGQVMGTEPSPFNQGYSIKLMEPLDGPVLAELSSSYSDGNGSGKLSVFDDFAMLESHFEPGSMEMKYNNGGIGGPPILLETTETTARLGIGTSILNEPISIGADLGAYYGEFVQVGNDDSGRYSGFMCGEDVDNRGVMLWYNNSNQLRLGSASGGTDYNGTMVIHEDQVAINTTTPGSQELYVVGDIYATGEILELSDVAVKTNIATIDGALELVDQLRGVRYNLRPELADELNATDDPQLGLIAQEVEPVLPEVVHSPEEGYKSLDYSRLTAVLVEAIKELKTENEDLRARIERLESK